ncbi:MarR family transcriptional regulator [Gimesia sp.]|uniref:MarR family winged helix-turn-helix transcriptional regulator n=1 Tax=Gimesia sp. TaxID=2024833 RepID=UPI000C6095AD|nr:MarR family transcriptional regulator [Gimesia sp.]MAX38938.1 MarR family transcriptional regulator [Gimesia sp.]HAH49185.1 MarR family transcriptional regulator [Planctomycetaceae bacterium]HBL45821.1 MarR family transcriptional regulator [Planctomycetaceae bacterium]|tara:strand:+ start:1447 stop:1905 length:459 start_codon:yes stop_codon:yes gene_type:complete
MLEYDFKQDCGYWVHMTAHRLENAVNAELQNEGITYRQCQILALLALEGEQSQGELAQRMRVQPPSIVVVLERMERDGLIKREVDPEDRRKRIVSPTKAALPVWNRIVKCFRAVRNQLERGLSESEVKALRSMLQRVDANLDHYSEATLKCE